MTCNIVNVWDGCGDGDASEDTYIPLVGTAEGYPVTGPINYLDPVIGSEWQQFHDEWFFGTNTFGFLGKGVDACFTIQTRSLTGVPYNFSFLPNGSFLIPSEEGGQYWALNSSEFFGVPNTLGIYAVDQNGNQLDRDVIISTAEGFGFDFKVDGTLQVPTSPDGSSHDKTVATKEYVLAQIPGTGGQDNIQSNLGTGVQLGAPKSGIDLPIRTLTTKNVNIEFVQNTNDVQINLAETPWFTSFLCNETANFNVAPECSADAAGPLELVRLSQLDGITDGMVATSGDQNVAGTKTFLDPIMGSAGIYDTAPVTTEQYRVVTNEVAAFNFVYKTQSVIAGNGLEGGGELNGDVTIDIGAGDGVSVLANKIRLNVDPNNFFFEDSVLKLNPFGIVLTTTDQVIQGTKEFSRPQSTYTGTKVDADLINWGDSLFTFALATRVMSAGDGLSGGGDLKANRSFAVDSTVLRTTGNQSISGTKTFNTASIANYNVGSAASGFTIANRDYVDFVSSDSRLKDNIVDADVNAAIDLLYTLPVREFDWKEDSGYTGHDYGFIAQEVEHVLPELVGELDGYKAVKYKKLIGVLWAQNKSQQEQISNLETRLAKLESLL